MFVLFGFWFWVMAICACVLLLWMIEDNESLFGSTIAFIMALVGLQYIFEVDIWNALMTQPLLIGIFAVCYCSIGLLYTAVWKWRVKVNAYSQQTKEDVKRFVINGDMTEDEFFANKSYFKMHPDNHKSFLMLTSLYWPFSLFWEITSKPIKFVYDILYTAFAGAFLKIARNSAK